MQILSSFFLSTARKKYPESVIESQQKEIRPHHVGLIYLESDRPGNSNDMGGV